MGIDLVGTCPKGEWGYWFSEGDCADDPASGQEYAWYTAHSLARLIRPGDRFYVVAHGRLRGWAPVVRIEAGRGSWEIIRAGSAVACTIDEPISGFRGLRRRWWSREEERPFPDWRTP